MLSCLVMVPVTDPLLTNGITKAVVCAILSSDGVFNRYLAYNWCNKGRGMCYPV